MKWILILAITPLFSCHPNKFVEISSYDSKEDCEHEIYNLENIFSDGSKYFCAQQLIKETK